MKNLTENQKQQHIDAMNNLTEQQKQELIARENEQEI